jgi:hypothetical protein
MSLGGGVTRQGAAHFAGWLLGLERLSTSPFPFPGGPLRTDLKSLEIEWKQHPRHLTIQPKFSGTGLSFQCKDMDEVYSHIHRALQSFWSPSCPGIQLRIKGLAHLAGALVGENDIETGRASFERVAFELLRYPEVGL